MLGCLLKLFIWIEIKIRRKLSQLKYDESAVVKFYDDKILEKTESTTTELSYTFINSIYIVKDKAIYMLANNGFNWIIPYKTFKSKKQYDDFIEYLYKVVKPNYKCEFVALEK